MLSIILELIGCGALKILHYRGMDGKGTVLEGSPHCLGLIIRATANRDAILKDLG